MIYILNQFSILNKIYKRMNIFYRNFCKCTFLIQFSRGKNLIDKNPTNILVTRFVLMGIYQVFDNHLNMLGLVFDRLHIRGLLLDRLYVIFSRRQASISSADLSSFIGTENSMELCECKVSRTKIIFDKCMNIIYIIDIII